MTDHTQHIDLHGWDCRNRAWHGPDELAYSLEGCRHILRKLRNTSGSWYGRLRKRAPGEPLLSFCVSVRDLSDASLGIIDLESSPGGPLEVVAVIPKQRLKRLRRDFAFEFVSFLRFLEGPESLGSEVAIHDYMEQVLREADGLRTLVFSIETRTVEPEVHMLIARHGGRLVMSMIAWMAEKDARQSAGL